MHERARNLGPFDVPEVLNIFMTADFTEDGSYTYKAAEIQKGDSYDMVSEMNMVVAISNCPDDILDDYNEHKPKRIVIHSAPCWKENRSESPSPFMNSPGCAPRGVWLLAGGSPAWEAEPTAPSIESWAVYR